MSALLLLIPLRASVRPALGWARVPVSLALGPFIMLLDVLMALTLTARYGNGRFVREFER